MGNCIAPQPHDGQAVPRVPPVRSTKKTVEMLEHGSSAMTSQIAAVCGELLPPWKSPRASDIDITVISGGISNALYRVSLQRAPSSPFDDSSVNSASDLFQTVVVLRIYGENTEKFVDREEEVETMRVLHRHGFGPEVLGVFGNGRIESYLGGMACLGPDDLGKPDVAVAIAETLARFHLISKSDRSKAREVFPVPRPAREDGILTPFKKTIAWLETTKTLEYDAAQRQAYEALQVDTILEEVRILEAKARQLKSPLAFTHNDLLSGNVMVERDEGDGKIRSMTFIDFEYADWAPRGFDLGNHFCEYAGFDCDYGKYPDCAEEFVSSYLGVYNGVKPSAEAVARVVKEANVYALAAHLYWGAWSMLQAKWSSIDFDYMGYAKLRIDEYYRRKRDFLQF
jgi:ethanolamine kinase